MKSLEEIAAFFKKRGFIFPNSEIYGGFAGFWDWGPLGVEIKRNVEDEWWKFFVRGRDDIVGIDGSIIAHPKVWEASGHVEGFTDLLVDCKKCRKRWRADHLVEDALKIEADGLSADALTSLIEENKIKCPSCKSGLSECKVFNLMFKTYVGPVEEDKAKTYLRPETAQSIFVDFKPVIDSMRLKLPFGIAQIGKVFRNEISPRNFIFRDREFTQMEIEFFVDPSKKKVPKRMMEQVSGVEMNVLSVSHQKSKKKPVEMKLKTCLSKKVIKDEWQGYWIALDYKWLVDMGINPKNLRIRQHLKEELSHYAEDNWDIDYHFPFGWKELQGHANRTQFDLTQHQKFSSKKLTYFDESSGKHVLPYVACEPSIGVERLVLALVVDAFTKEKERDVLKLKPQLAPVKVAIFPLVSKDGLDEKAYEIHKMLKPHYPCFYDQSGSIGRRYRRQDEVGTPICLTVDYDTMENGTVTVRDRDTMDQKRIRIEELLEHITNFFKE
jgi:glycyl-tRNA synthetase